MFRNFDVIFKCLGFGRFGVLIEEHFDDAEFALHSDDTVFFVHDGFAHFELEEVLLGFAEETFLALASFVLEIAIAGVGVGVGAVAESEGVKIFGFENFGASDGLWMCGVV